MKRIIWIILLGALFLNSCSFFLDSEESVGKLEAINVAGTGNSSIKSTLLSGNVADNATIATQWTELDWVTYTDGKIDAGKMPTVTQNKLQEIMERDISKMFKTKSTLVKVSFESDVTVIDLYTEDSNISLLFCYELDKIATSVGNVLAHNTLVRLNLCDKDEAGKIIDSYIEAEEVRAKISTAVIFTINLQSLPDAETASEAILKEYIRKKAIYDEYGTDANRLSDPEVLKDQYKILESSGSDMYVVAPRLGDGIFIAVKYSDMTDLVKFNIVNEAREVYSEIIGKESQVTMFYYSEAGWSRLKYDLKGYNRQDLTVADIECVAKTEYLNSNEDFLKTVSAQYGIVREWVGIADARDNALIAHYQNGGTKQTFSWSEYPVTTPEPGKIKESQESIEREVKWDLIEYNQELAGGKMSGYPATGADFIPSSWFSKWHSLDYIRTDREGRIDLLAIREFRRAEDWSNFCEVLEEDITTYFHTKEILVYPLIYNGNIKLDLYIRDDLLMAKKIFVDLERILFFMEPVFTPTTKIKITLNVCDPKEWEIVMQGHEDTSQELLKRLADNSRDMNVSKSDLEVYLVDILPVWLEVYTVRFKMEVDDYRSEADIAQAMLNSYYQLHYALEQAK